MKISKFGSRPFFYDIQPRLFRAEHRKPDKIRSMDCFLFCQFMNVWYNKPPRCQSVLNVFGTDINLAFVGTK